MPLDYTEKKQSPSCALGTPSAGVEECRVQHAVTAERVCWKRCWKCPDEPRYWGSKTKGDVFQYLLGMRQEITCYTKHPQPQLPIQTGFDIKYHLPNQRPLAGSSYWALLCAFPQPP